MRQANEDNEFMFYANELNLHRGTWSQPTRGYGTGARPDFPIVICPGMHPSSWTDAFLDGTGLNRQHRCPVHVFPAHQHPAFSGHHVFQFMRRCLHPPVALCPPVILIAFSAGVVGAAQAAGMWQVLGGRLQAFVALDGWGVPLPNGWPIYRLSHDGFTDWSTALIGGGCDRFCADPPVEHRQLWEAPQRTVGWWRHQPTHDSMRQTRTTATSFIQHLVLDGSRSHWVEALQ